LWLKARWARPRLNAIHRAGARANDRQPGDGGTDVAGCWIRRRPLKKSTAYGNVEAREELEKLSISVLAPVHSTSPGDGTIPKAEFAIDLQTDTVTCPPRQGGADLQA
jgi:hypothetical protein